MLSEGTILGDKYRIDRVIASGGMGVVFASTHLVLGREVAVKVLRRDLADDRRAASRLLAEARAVAGLKSEHIAQVIDVGAHDGAPFIVMELLHGKTVYETVQAEGPIGFERAADLLIQACHGLGAAHQRGIVHRDVKPSNLFIARGDDGERLKVIDFGVSKNRPFEAAGKGEQETTTGTLLGSPSFMSPEQIRSSRDVDGRSDLWSLGVVLHFMLTGARPFDAESLLDLMTLIVHEPPPSLRRAREGSPAGLEAVVARCLEKDPARRFATTAELAKALAPFASPRMRALATKVPVGTVTPAAEPDSEPPSSRARERATVPEETTSPMPAPPSDETVSLHKPGTATPLLASIDVTPAPRSRRRVAPLIVAVGLALGLAAGLALVARKTPTSPSPTAATADPQPAPAPAPAPSPPSPDPPSGASVSPVSTTAIPPTSFAARAPTPPPRSRSRAPAAPKGTVVPSPRPAAPPPARPELPSTPD